MGHTIYRDHIMNRSSFISCSLACGTSDLSASGRAPLSVIITDLRGLSFEVLSLYALGQIKWSTVRSAIMIDLWNYEVLPLQTGGYISGGGVQFSLAPSPIESSGGHKGRFSRDPLPVFSAGGLREQFWYGLGCSLFDVVHPAFPLPTTASPTSKVS